jgi:hypothetical protein
MKKLQNCARKRSEINENYDHGGAFFHVAAVSLEKRR